MAQTEARPYVSIYVAIDTPDAPMLDGKPVRTVSWTANRFSSGHTNFTVCAHHACGHLVPLLDAESIDPALVPDWVPWPPANWLASLEPDDDDLQAIIDAETYHFEHSGAGSWRS